MSYPGQALMVIAFVLRQTTSIPQTFIVFLAPPPIPRATNGPSKSNALAVKGGETSSMPSGTSDITCWAVVLAASLHFMQDRTVLLANPRPLGTQAILLDLAKVSVGESL